MRCTVSCQFLIVLLVLITVVMVGLGIVFVLAYLFNVCMCSPQLKACLMS